MATLHCPTCGRSFEKSATTPLPFCSPRCRQVDLGRWLGESYSLPIYRFDEDEEADELYDEPEPEDD